MNNDQLEQPVSANEQADSGQNGGANGANGVGASVGAASGAASGANGGAAEEGAVPSTVAGDMPGPVPTVGANGGNGGSDAAADTGADADVAAGVGEDPGAVDYSGADMDAGHVDVAGDAGDAAAAGTAGAGGAGGQGGDGADGNAAPDELSVRPARDPRLDNVGPNASMEDLLRASEQQYRTLKHNDVIEGTVMRVDRDEVLVDIGAKTEGIIPSRELQSLTPEEREAMQPGDPVLVAVVQPENNEGHALLSLDRARQERSWRDLQHKFEAGEIIQAAVSGHNKGGLLVNIEGVRGFVPSSQISSLPPGEANKQAELSRYHGQTLPLKIIEINRNRNRLILSERQAMQEQRESMRTRLLRELEPGQIRPGTVTSIADFGAFVDIGGADGLIHLSELSWKRVNNPREVLSVGDHINVYVLSVDPNERKIALSLKRTQPEPWSTITENYTLGQVVRGTITQLTSFGAFARLEDGIEGLIHVSELAEGRVAHPKNVVNVGDQVDLKVIRIDPVKRRIGLSLKRMNEDGASGGTAGEPGAYGTEGVYEAGAVASQLDDYKPALGVETEIDPTLSRDEHAMPPVQAPAPEPAQGGQQQPLPARQAQFQREPQQRDRDRDRDRGRDRDRDRDRGGAGTPAGGDDEPMSAMAQAFAAFAQQRGGLDVAGGDQESGGRSGGSQGNRGGQGSQATQPAQSAAPAPQASAPAGQDTGDTGDTGNGGDTGATDAAGATDTGATDAGDSGTADVEPEASMPSAESIATAEDNTADETGSTDAQGSEGPEASLADAAADAGGDGGTDSGASGTSGGEVQPNDNAATSTVNEEGGSTGAIEATDTADTADAAASDTTDTQASGDDDSSGAASGSEAMPSVADAGPVDGEAGGSGDEFNG